MFSQTGSGRKRRGRGLPLISAHIKRQHVGYARRKRYRKRRRGGSILGVVKHWADKAHHYIKKNRVISNYGHHAVNKIIPHKYQQLAHSVVNLAGKAGYGRRRRRRRRRGRGIDTRTFKQRLRSNQQYLGLGRRHRHRRHRHRVHRHRVHRHRVHRHRVHRHRRRGRGVLNNGAVLGGRRRAGRRGGFRHLGVVSVGGSRHKKARRTGGYRHGMHKSHRRHGGGFFEDVGNSLKKPSTWAGIASPLAGLIPGVGWAAAPALGALSAGLAASGNGRRKHRGRGVGKVGGLFTIPVHKGVGGGSRKRIHHIRRRGRGSPWPFVNADSIKGRTMYGV
jgi:hypothetical protein